MGAMRASQLHTPFNVSMLKGWGVKRQEESQTEIGHLKLKATEESTLMDLCMHWPLRWTDPAIPWLAETEHPCFLEPRL